MPSVLNYWLIETSGANPSNVRPVWLTVSPDSGMVNKPTQFEAGGMRGRKRERPQLTKGDKMTDEEIQQIEENIDNLFIEEQQTVSFPVGDDIHTISKTFKLGYSVNIPYEIGEERTRTYMKNKIRKALDYEIEQCKKRYKCQKLH